MNNVFSLKDSIIYEDEKIFVFHKPAGLHSVMHPKHSHASLAEKIFEAYPELQAASPNQNDVGLVNRLDFSTSGLILAARERSTWESLHRLFKERKVEKRYIALVEGKFPQEQKIETFIGSEYRRSKKVKNYQTQDENPRAQAAFSHFRRQHYDVDKDISVVEVEISTGVRHQIRAHASYIGHPLLGDEPYRSNRALAEYLDSDRDFFLHASKLCFTHPLDGERKTFIAPPKELKSLEHS